MPEIEHLEAIPFNVGFFEGAYVRLDHLAHLYGVSGQKAREQTRPVQGWDDFKGDNGYVDCAVMERSENLTWTCDPRDEGQPSICVFPVQLSLERRYCRLGCW